MKLKILSIFGTRPEAIKMAPVLKELGKRTDQFVSKCCVTAQHRDMLDQMLNLFDIKPDYDLDLMTAGQSLPKLSARLFDSLDAVISEEKPDWILVQGDTTTVMIASLLAHYSRVKVGHVEAGLRSGDNYSPYPEEVNRRIVGVTADLHFAPTSVAKDNLLREGIPSSQIAVTGNTVIDALNWVVEQPYDFDKGPLKDVPWSKKIVLVTAHRRESFGQPIKDICSALKEIAHAFNDAHIVYPVHPNPNVHGPVNAMLGGVKNITLLPPLDYQPLAHLVNHAHLVLTDSGGIQEEAPSFKKPVLVLREKTERPEGIEAGLARLVGTDGKRIVEEVERLWNDKEAYAAMVSAENPYGDGKAAERVVDALLHSQRQVT